jgi:hypothetical protein
MSLLTPASARTVPPLYTSEDEPDPMVVLKFFLPGTRWTWFVIEGALEDPDGCGWGEGCDHTSLTTWVEHPENDALFFGYVRSGLGPDCDELGFFRLSELASLATPFHVERDLYFTPCRLSEVRS